MSPLRVGLTGNIGSGKSSVAGLLREHGAAVIDADALARQATDDPQVLASIARELGPDLLTDGRLDRAATAERVFGDPSARRRLNAIVHPWVRRASAEREAALLASRPLPRVIVHDVPLLFESGLQDGFDVVVVVTAPLERRIERVTGRSALSADEVRARDAAQMPLDAKAARAGYVVDNSGSPAELAARVDRLWLELEALADRQDGLGAAP